MSQKPHTAIAVVGIDIGKNSFHVVGLDQRGAIVLRQKWSRSQVDARFANMPPCLVGMEACVGAHNNRTISSRRWQFSDQLHSSPTAKWRTAFAAVHE
jgi:hypothetical protein